MGSLFSEKNRMNWDHEPKTRKSLEINLRLFRFMESPFSEKPHELGP
jgi:hypothetical protein